MLKNFLDNTNYKISQLGIGRISYKGIFYNVEFDIDYMCGIQYDTMRYYRKWVI